MGLRTGETLGILAACLGRAFTFLQAISAVGQMCAHGGTCCFGIFCMNGIENTFMLLVNAAQIGQTLRGHG